MINLITIKEILLVFEEKMCATQRFVCCENEKKGIGCDSEINEDKRDPKYMHAYA